MALMVYITVPEQDLARKMARMLVESKLAAGVNISGPVESIYRWQGAIHAAAEWQLFAQVAGKDYADFEKAVLTMHPYRVPCIMAFTVAAGHLPFLQWTEQRGE